MKFIDTEEDKQKRVYMERWKVGTKLKNKKALAIPSPGSLLHEAVAEFPN